MGASETRMGDRRKFVRLHSRIRAAYQSLGKEDPLETLTKNVSGGGLSVFTKVRQAPGTILGLELHFPGRIAPVRFTAQVVWSGEVIADAPVDPDRAYETGVRFLDIEPEDREFLLKFAEANPFT